MWRYSDPLSVADVVDSLHQFDDRCVAVEVTVYLELILIYLRRRPQSSPLADPRDRLPASQNMQTECFILFTLPYQAHD